MDGLFSDRNLERASRLLWGLVLFTLPVTTFPFTPGPLGRTTIKPLAFFPLALLLPVLVLLFLRRRKLALPPNSIPLIAFILFALLASFIAYLYAPPDLAGHTYVERSLRAWISLGAGLSFFMVAFWMNRNEEDLQQTLKWLYAGLIVTIVWSLIQAVAVNTDLLRRSTIDQIQLLFSERGVQPRRITGFAYEPAWLADQLIIFNMPWLFAGLLTRRYLTRYKWLEPLLFVLCLILLLLTYSRSGLAEALIVIPLVALILGRDWLRRLWNWFSAPFKGLSDSGDRIALVLRLGLVLALIFGAFAALSFLGQYQYFASIWQIEADESVLDYIIDVSAGQRLAYSIAGYKIFEQHPLTGIGFGAAGLYLFENYPEWSFTIPEVARQISPDSTLFPNTKSLYVRLLAETGLPGFWLFMVFFVSFLGIIRVQWISGQAAFRYVAVAGLFIWLSLLVRNLTQDSLTFPIMWTSLGILAGLMPKAIRSHT